MHINFHQDLRVVGLDVNMYPMLFASSYPEYEILCAYYLSSGAWGEFQSRYGPSALTALSPWFLISVPVVPASALMFGFPAMLLVTT